VNPAHCLGTTSPIRLTSSPQGLPPSP
jgi:hypothetical protein